MIHFNNECKNYMLNTTTYDMTTTAMEKLYPGGEAGKKCSRMPIKLLLVVWNRERYFAFIFYMVFHIVLLFL